MSAPNESAAPAANPSTDDAARLQQPSDAVPMESIPQSQPESSSAAAPPMTLAPGADSSKAADAITTTDKPDAAAAPVTAASTERDEDRSDSILAIGPAQDDIAGMAPGAADGPVCQITLLLTTGTRHPYKIDARYLAKRSVPVPETTEAGQPDPFSISIYTLKELILREWRSDWEAKPASPSSIRLIHFGKLLDDKEPLKKYQFTTDSPNVVHMSIRPQDLDEEEPKGNSKAAGSGGAGSTRERSTNCCVVL
ncbi:hypothetical protein NLU13_4730 [Sarocladium strictum]|uniref:UBL3-like ubiquitin domain-containing protein n=1 Tax=Sarocladium strictum TaxID=5046 RepID=A0AA39L8G2_SARSR|nr:hypothetical protein NLU13_4730 [Sarocladium strictum]